MNKSDGCEDLLKAFEGRKIQEISMATANADGTGTACIVIRLTDERQINFYLESGSRIQGMLPGGTFEWVR